MNKLTLLLLLFVVTVLVGCKETNKPIDYKTLSISDQILALEMQRNLFNGMKTTFDEYAQIHDIVYPESKPLKDENVFTFRNDGETIEIKGEALIGLSLKKQKVYLAKMGSAYIEAPSDEGMNLKETLSVSDVYKDKTLDWYFVFTLRKLAFPEGDAYIPSRYTLEKAGDQYQVVEYESDMRLGISDEETTNAYLKKSGCSTFYSEPVTYIKTVSY